MKHAKFDERLDEIMVRAAVRFQTRMTRALARGHLFEFLRRIGFAEELGVAQRCDVKSSTQERAVVLLAKKIRNARRGGFLPDFLQSLNMKDLLPRGRREEPEVCACVLEGTKKGGEARPLPTKPKAHGYGLRLVK